MVILDFDLAQEKNFSYKDLNILRDKPSATQKEIVSIIGKSERTVKTITVNLTQKGMIERKNGKRNGFWQINILE